MNSTEIIEAPRVIEPDQILNQADWARKLSRKEQIARTEAAAKDWQAWQIACVKKAFGL